MHRLVLALSRFVVAFALLILPALTVAGQVTDYPPGTLLFHATKSLEVVAAPGGGVWAATPQGVVHYSEAGPRVVAALPADPPRHLAVAPDGSLWLSNGSRIMRLSASGAVLEQYAVADARDLAVAHDGAAWYARGELGRTLGRIAGGVPREFPSPVQAWSLVPAGGAEIWLLGNGSGIRSDSVYRINATGAAMATPLGHDVLFGFLQVLPDGTLYITTGLHGALLRLASGAATVELVASGSLEFLVEPGRDYWIGSYWLLGRITESPAQGDVFRRMPGVPQLCQTWPIHIYQPVAFDADGYLWVRVLEEYEGFVGFPPPCPHPTPAALPDLIRIDVARFLAEHAPLENVPALSPVMLFALAAAIAVVAASQLRT